MKFKHWTIAIVTLFLILFAGLNYSWAEPKIWADSAILMDAKTGDVYYEKEANRERHPASLTKIMTGIIALEYGNLEDVVTISKRAANIEIGQTIKLRAGQKITLEDLLYGALMHSANDAAVAIAEHVGGTEEIFIEMMNQKALALGATKTHFVNANGYSKPNHRTTAYDLALITRYAMENPKFVAIVNTKSRILNKIGEDDIEIKNINKILKLYPKSLGVKTGTTAAAGGCLASFAKEDDKSLIAIVLKSGKTKRYQDCMELFEYGFNEVEQVTFLKKNESWDEIYNPNGKPNVLNILVKENLKVNLAKDQLFKLEKKLELNRFPQLPIEKGTKLGVLRVYMGEQELTSVDLIAGNKVDKKTFWNSLLP